MSNITEESYLKTYYASTYSNGMPSTLHDISKTTAFCDDYNKKVIDNILSTRPDYYGGKDATYEVFNVLEAWGLDKDFYLGNVIKYIARASKKNELTEKEDLEKALVYLQRRIATL